jgi:nitrite reductase/ring-hydroxylating ferredoxin subunit
VGRQEDLELDGLKAVSVEGVPICLARTADGMIRAISNVCSHEQASLSEGSIIGTSVECPAHGSLFDLVTGRVSGAPAETAIPTYSVTIEDGQIVVEL